jgi:predicted MPP superfamily phosphohydrolase
MTEPDQVAPERAASRWTGSAVRALTSGVRRAAAILRRVEARSGGVGPILRRTGTRLRRRWPSVARVVGVVVVALIGSTVGAGLAPSTITRVGPFEVGLRVVPSWDPGVVLELPPAGRVEFRTHRAPVAVQAAMGEVDLEGARGLLGSRAALDELERSAPDVLRSATVRASVTTGGCALLGAVGLSVLVYRRRVRRTAQVAGVLVVALAGMALTTVTTFDADRMAQPHFTGLLSKAPYVAGQAESMLARLQSYRAGLADIVDGVTALYAASGELPVLPETASDDVVVMLHVSDLHLNPIGFDLIDRLVEQFKADLVVDTGDITTWGTEVEGTTLSRVGKVGVPYVFVRGNHDSRLTQRAVAASRNAVVLDGAIAQVAGVVIAGIGDPTFTPDRAQNVPSGASVPVPPSTSPTPPTPPTSPTSPAPPDQEIAESTDLQAQAGHRLAGLIRSWDDQHPQSPVTIAAVHQPSATAPLLTMVPLVLAGHVHHREVSVDKSTGTRLMVEGSTGGAGVTATGMAAADRGSPVPLNATLIYLARRGPLTGEVLAYDEVTVGGLGLASISLNRTVVRQPEARAPATPNPAIPTTRPTTR